MVEISATMVKELRDKSGAAMMDCKKALVEASGDFEKAFEWLRQKGIAVATKKSARTTSEGLVVGLVSDDLKAGAIVEINCETDFVARNEQFVALAKEVAQVTLKSRSRDVDTLLNQSIGGKSLKEKLTEAVATTGENIVVKRVAVLELGGKPGVIGLYVHALGGKMGALVALEATKDGNKEVFQSIGREVAMHVVSAKPQYLSRTEVPAAVVDNERRIESGKADLAEKKPEMRDKIVSGRVDKLLAERCLADQPFVKDPSLSVSKYVASKAAEAGAELKPTRFALFILGETQAAEANGKDH